MASQATTGFVLYNGTGTAKDEVNTRGGCCWTAFAALTPSSSSRSRQTRLWTIQGCTGWGKRQSRSL